MSEKILGVDASNIRHGGGLTHLREILSYFDPSVSVFSKIIIWAPITTLVLLDESPYLIKVSSPLLNSFSFLRFFWQFLILPFKAKSSKVSLLFVPGGIHSGLFRDVVTMHQNMLPFSLKEAFRFPFPSFCKFLLLRYLQLYSFSRSKGVIFLSEYARSAILRLVPTYKFQSIIVPHGVADRFLQQSSSLPVLNSRNSPVKLLYVSTLDYYKNHLNLLSALSLLRASSDVPFTVDLVGGFRQPLFQSISSLIRSIDPDLAWIFVHGECDYDSISCYYQNADIALWPSSCEAYGILLLVYLASSLPICSSCVGPAREVLDSASLYFDPSNPIDIYLCLKRMVESTSLQRHFSDLSSQRLCKLLTWKQVSFSTFSFLSSFV